MTGGSDVDVKDARLVQWCFSRGELCFKVIPEIERQRIVELQEIVNVGREVPNEQPQGFQVEFNREREGRCRANALTQIVFPRVVRRIGVVA